MSVLDPAAVGGVFTVGGKRCALYFGEDGTANPVTEQVNAEGGEGPRATAIMQCLWPERYDVFRGLLGTSIVAGGVIVRTLPLAYPDSPNLWCLDVGQVVPVKPRWGGAWFTAELARFPATFGVPRWSFDAEAASDPSGQPWTTTRVRVSAEVTSVPTGTFVWTAGDQAGKKVPDSQLGLLAPRNEISMTRHWMPFVPLRQVNGFIGTLNSQPIVLSDHTYAPGYVLFAGFNATESVDTLGNRTYEVEYVMLGSITHDWNALLDRGLVYRLVNTKQDRSGNYPFTYSDFWNGLP